uniref:GcrA cell cycle regulator n=1 Tax=Globodera pallida TaxID=36090 RepID=A0A183C9R2_GLOPA
ESQTDAESKYTIFCDRHDHYRPSRLPAKGRTDTAQ